MAIAKCDLLQQSSSSTCFELTFPPKNVHCLSDVFLLVSGVVVHDTPFWLLPRQVIVGRLTPL